MATGETTETAEEAKSPGWSMWLTCKSMRAKFPSVRQIATDELDRLLKAQQASDGSNEVLLLDSRPVEEYSISHIPDAVRVDHGGDLTPALDRIRQENDTSRPLAVVAYCSVGYRSSVVAKRLEEELKKLPSGNSNRPISIYNLEGSLFKWANEGRAMEDSECKTTTLAHPYSSLWGRLLNKQLHCWSR
ncbi:uncharacterized protein [Branchiostoma lanceolatum]|uniref:uncharacterized protein n=1 Tax=Branchiostoma lanceolatum TaxID=7740 RepID=UPI003455583B